MKLSKQFLEIIEKEDNEKGDILLAMIEEPENTIEDLTAVAVDFLVDSADYDGNVLKLHQFIALNILSDDEEEEEESEPELTTLDILAGDIDPNDDDWNDFDDDEDEDDR